MANSHNIFTKESWVIDICLLIIALAHTTSVYSDETSEVHVNDLNTQVQAIKNEAIELTNKLRRLEEQLLYPAHTQVSIFLSASNDSIAALQSVSLKIDNKTATHHIYTQKEILALQSGGIQRLYTGNTTMGKHELSVVLNEILSDEDARKSETQYIYDKSEKVKFIELIISRGQANDKRVSVREWN